MAPNLSNRILCALEGLKQDKPHNLGSHRRYCVFDVTMPGQGADRAAKTNSKTNAIVECFAQEGESWEVYKPRDNNWPAEDLTFEAFIVTGISSCAVNVEEEKWIVLLLSYLRGLHKRRKLIFGCGFGAQIVAQALGGKMSPSPTENEHHVRKLTFGALTCDENEPQSVEYKATSSFASMWYTDGAYPFPSKLELQHTHHDQLAELPCGAEVFFTSGKNTIEGFGIGDTVLCILGLPDWNGFKTCTGSALLDQENRSPRGTTTKAGSAFTDMCKRFLKTPSSMRWSGWSIGRYDV